MPHSILNHCQDCQVVIASYWQRCYDCRLIKAAANLSASKAATRKPMLPNSNPADILKFWSPR